MNDDDDKTQYDSYYGHFPYKSYDEIQSEKRRKRRVRQGCFLGLFLFAAMTAIIICISIWGGKLLFSSPKLPAGKEVPQDDASVNLPQSENTENPSDGEPNISITAPPAGDSAIVVKDVSGVVTKAADWVVGIVAESYREFSSTSSGSGVILTDDGYIVTNNHVISGSDSIVVLTNDGNSYPAYVIGTDAYTDIAVIKIDIKNLPKAELGDSEALRVGEAAIAIGNPTGQLQGTVTAGIVSALNRNILVKSTVMNLIQTDASINPGNSGGALLNEHGQVVGITSVKLSNPDYEGLGFAIPMNTVKPVVEELIRDGYVSGRPLVGVSGRTVSAMAGAFYSLPQGILVDDIEQSSDAFSKGISVGDVVVSINDVRIYDISDAVTARNKCKVGEKVKLSVYRKGKTYEVEVKLIERANLGENFNF